MESGVYQMSFSGLTFRECWRLSRGIAFPLALLLKLIGFRGPCSWLPIHEAEVPCSKEEWSDETRAVLDPILDQLADLGYPNYYCAKLVKNFNPSWRDGGIAYALHKDGKRSICIAYTRSEQFGNTDATTIVSGGILLEDGSSVDVHNGIHFLDGANTKKVTVLRKGSTLIDVANEVERQQNEILNPVRHFPSLNALQDFLKEHEEYEWDAKIKRGLYHRVSPKKETEILDRFPDASCPPLDMSNTGSDPTVNGNTTPELPADSAPEITHDDDSVILKPVHDAESVMLKSVTDAMHAIDAKEKGGWKKNLITLAITIFLFISLGLFRTSFASILMIVGVIFIHEMGHFIGMKLFKYKDVKMFFIPMLGAAVSGMETAPSGGKKAIVSLLGPVPGILIGIGTGAAYFITKEPLLADATRTFLFLNTFNLLPFHPLDGGRLFDAILFSRHPKIEVGFKVVTLLLLALLALAFKDVLLGILAVSILMSIPATNIVASIAHKLKKEMADSLNESLDEQPPASAILCILKLLKQKIPEQQSTPNLLATYVNGIWQRVRNRPCSIGATIALLLMHGFFFCLGGCSAFIFEVGKMSTEEPVVAYETRTLEDGRTITVHTEYQEEMKVSETELNDEGLFNGNHTQWYWIGCTNINLTGSWTNGYRHGKWEYYDPMGEIIDIVEYDEGIVTNYQSRSDDGKLEDIPTNDWSDLLEFIIQDEPLPEENQINPEDRL